MVECAAFRDLGFWRASSELPQSGASPGWLAALRSDFGLPETTGSFRDHAGAVHSYVLQPIEIVLPVTPTQSLVWATEGPALEHTLLLREPGLEDAALGWLDSHAMPFALRLEEALRLSAAISRGALWSGSPAPFLLLSRFVGLTDRDQAVRALSAEAAALQALGLISNAPLQFGEEPSPYQLSAEMGVVTHTCHCGDATLKTAAQTGLRWVEAQDGDWELVAHKRWDGLSEAGGVDTPIPCHSIRQRDPYRFFPAAGARARADERDGEAREDDASRDPEFPFERMRALLQAI